MTLQERFGEIIKTLEEREKNYDSPTENFKKIGIMWSVVLGHEVTPEQVALCMIVTKVAREVYTHGEDNLLDIGGYLACLWKIMDNKTMSAEKG